MQLDGSHSSMRQLVHIYYLALVPLQSLLFFHALLRCMWGFQRREVHVGFS